MNSERANLWFYIHETINIVITVSIFVLLFLIASKVFHNISSLFNIITV